MSDIMSISRLRMGTDGAGITTLVAFHGCPLNCKYCVNHQCHETDIKRADFTSNELIKVLSVDEPYYLMTGGGVTFGGGEPLLQAEFIHDVCRNMNKKWRRTIETSLYVDWRQIEMIVDDMDYWFVDIKDVNKEIYRAYTGRSNQKVLRNLRKLVDIVGMEKVCVRLPLIHEFNTEADRENSIKYIRENVAPSISVDLFDYIRC